MILLLLLLLAAYLVIGWFPIPTGYKGQILSPVFDNLLCLQFILYILIKRS